MIAIPTLVSENFGKGLSPVSRDSPQRFVRWLRGVKVKSLPNPLSGMDGA
jgi:hypothetical protein